VTLGVYACAGTLTAEKRARTGKTSQRRVFIVVSFARLGFRGCAALQEFGRAEPDTERKCRTDAPRSNA
jgi:hypothetical protein